MTGVTGVTGVMADIGPGHCPGFRLSRDENSKGASRRLPTPLSLAYVCKSALYLNIIDFRPRIGHRALVSHCVRLISMAFLSVENDKCI